MKPDPQIKNILNDLLIIKDKKTIDRLDKYVDIIKIWSGKMNLISRGDLAALLTKHIIPSFWLFDTIKIKDSQSVLDIGSGSGLPGVVLKILNPTLKTFLIESNRKKALFLKEVSEKLEINPVIINERMETFAYETIESFDVIVSRAVTSINTIWGWAKAALKDGGSAYIFKGLDFENEIQDLDNSNIRINIYNPTDKWVANSPQLMNKVIIKMEKK